MNKKQQKQLLMAMAIFAALYFMFGKSAMAALDGKMDPTGLWGLPRDASCESSYSDSTGKQVCGVSELIQKNIHGQQ